MIEYITLAFVLLNTVLFLILINNLGIIIQLLEISLKKASDDLDEIITDIKKHEDAEQTEKKN